MAKLYCKKKRTRSKTVSVVLHIIFALLDIGFTCVLLGTTKLNVLAILAYVFGHAVVIINCLREYGLESLPLVDLLLKILLVTDISSLVRNFEIQMGGFFGKYAEIFLNYNKAKTFKEGLQYLFIRPIVLYLALIILYIIAFILVTLNFGKVDKRHSYLLMNRILDSEKKLPPLDEIPKYEPFSSAGYRENEYVNWQKAMIQYIGNGTYSPEIKATLIDMIQSRKENVWATNEIQLEYFKLIEGCMKQSFKKDNAGNWIDEILLDRKTQKLPLEIPEEIKTIRKYSYTTPLLSDLGTRVKKEVNLPWQEFTERRNQLNPAAWMKEFAKGYTGIAAGELGEDRVAKELSLYEDQMIILPNLRIEEEGESVENDFVLVSPWGIYILEVKNMGQSGAFDLIVEKDGRWLKAWGKVREPIESPVHQNERHIVYMEKMLNKKMGRTLDERILIRGMVVIANDQVTIKNQSDNIVKRYDNIISTIRSGERVLKEEEMKQIAEILRDEALKVKPHPILNFAKYYAETKFLTDEYCHWKTNTKDLIEYAGTYQKNVLKGDEMLCKRNGW